MRNSRVTSVTSAPAVRTSTTSGISAESRTRWYTSPSAVVSKTVRKLSWRASTSLMAADSASVSMDSCTRTTWP
ncbi:Uncharacterised protein [Mycobacteroides abscessus subsp. abscessus]|nr:Uncharacterised protein [Mycobacteroides abscessus subsp. abscessus]